MKIYINGKLFPKKDAKISVFDHGLLYGDGVFEGVRVYEGKLAFLKEHVERLFWSARAIDLKIPMTRQGIAKAVIRTCRENKLYNGYVRLVVTRGEGDLGLNPYICPRPQVIIIAGGIQIYAKKLYDTGMEIVTVATIRNNPESINPAIKSLNYLNNILAKIEAINAGAIEALMLNIHGFVAEATGDNILIVNGKTISTPPASEGALLGITRSTVMKLAAERGFVVQEKRLTRYDIYNADEVFLTGTAAEVIGVVKMDRRVIGDGKPGPVTRDLQRRYHRYAVETGVPVC